MAIDGTYKVEMSTQMGSQTGEIIIKSEGNTVNGTYKSPRGEQPFNGTLDGDKAKWTINIQSPMGSVALAFDVAVSGNELTGTVQMGQFGSAPIKGTKAE